MKKLIIFVSQISSKAWEKEYAGASENKGKEAQKNQAQSFSGGNTEGYAGV